MQSPFSATSQAGAPSRPWAGTSRWLIVDQPMIDGFGRITLDPDPMHIDPQWAADHSPFGETIAFGFLTVSLLTHLLHDAMGRSSGSAGTGGYYLNYGFDRLRLITPVRVGSKIRGDFVKAAEEQDAQGRIRARFTSTIEIEGGTRPALVADWLSLWVPRPDAEA